MTEWVNTRKRGSSTARVYHTDKECRYLGADIREVQTNEIDAMGLRECEACKGEINSHDGGDKSTYELIKRIGERRDE